METILNPLRGSNIFWESFYAEQGTDINFHVKNSNNKWVIVKAHSAIVALSCQWLMNPICKRNEKGSFDVIFDDNISSEDLQDALKILYQGEINVVNMSRFENINSILALFRIENVKKVETSTHAKELMNVSNLDLVPVTYETREEPCSSHTYDHIEVKVEDTADETFVSKSETVLKCEATNSPNATKERDEPEESEPEPDMRDEFLESHLQEPESKRLKLNIQTETDKSDTQSHLETDPEWIAVSDDEADSVMLCDKDTGYMVSSDSERVPKSLKRYQSAWENFQIFRNSKEKPKEQDYLRYFQWLHHEKKFVGTTIWSIYARLNYTHQKLYSEKIQRWPKISTMIGSFQQHSKKQAQAFSSAEIQQFMRMENAESETSYWILRKAVVAVAFCGGLSCNEVWKLLYSDVQKTGNSFCITSQKTTRSTDDKLLNVIHIPENRRDVSVCFASKFQKYLNRVVLSNGPFKPSDKLFKSCSKGKANFTTQPFGKNQMAKLGKEVAELLGLPNPEKYTGQCWRRSVKTHMDPAILEPTESWSVD